MPASRSGLVGHPTDLTQGPDLALLRIDDPALDLPPSNWRGWTGTAAAETPWSAATPGATPSSPNSPYENKPGTVRETIDAAGIILVGSGLVHGLLDLQVSIAPRDLPPTGTPIEESPWSGMSGAPVITGGRLIGVITEHAPRAGPSSLTVTPLTAIQHDPGHPGWGPGLTDPDTWWTLLRATGLDALTRLPIPSARPAPPYAATLRSLGRAMAKRVPVMLGREAELQRSWSSPPATAATGG